MRIIFSENIYKSDFEIVERKGDGHPDTLADHLAEYLSVQYSKYTLKSFGVILHHNFDKIGILGGKSEVKFGSGKLISPIRVLINGRASNSFSGDHFDEWKLITTWTKLFFKEKFPLINIRKDLVFFNNLSTQSSPGQQLDNISKSARNFWFQPRNLSDLPEQQRLFSNDTSLGVGFAPNSILENLVLSIEELLNRPDYKKCNIWIGSDIKIMGIREKKKYFLTLCIPQIANYVRSVREYLANLEIAKKDIFRISQNLGIYNFDLNINTRDSIEHGEFYLTAIGSSIESGDEGLVGRGNRVNKLITPTKPMSMEGAAGKNPVYHVGKVYNLFANELAKKIYQKYSIENYVTIVSQSGRNLNDPWIVSVAFSGKVDDLGDLKIFIKDQFKNIKDITNDILDFKYSIA